MGGAWERIIGIACRKLVLLVSHEVFTTLIAEVMAIMNSQPIVPVSMNPEMPAALTPVMLLTEHIETTTAPPGDFNSKQRKQVQSLADTFWKRWRQENLVTLQSRRKRQVDKPASWRCHLTKRHTSPPKQMA